MWRLYFRSLTQPRTTGKFGLPWRVDGVKSPVKQGGEGIRVIELRGPVLLLLLRRTYPAGSLSSAATIMPTRGRLRDVFSTATLKMGIMGESIVGHAASCTNANGTATSEPTAAQEARQSTIMDGCRHWYPFGSAALASPCDAAQVSVCGVQGLGQ